MQRNTETTGMTLETMQTLVEELRRRAVPATLEYPGFICVRVSATGTEFHWGGAHEMFGADVFEVPFYASSAPDEYIDSDIPSNSTDVIRLADFIACAFTEACGQAPEYQLPEVL